MTSRKRANLKARLGIATAVLVGGGAIGGVAVATSGHSAPTNAQSAGYSHSSSSGIPWGTALSSAIYSSHSSQAFSELSRMSPLHVYGESWHHRTEFAAQRGVVLLATKHFLVVKSSNGAVHVWWLGGTKTFNVSSSSTGMTAMTGSSWASSSAMTSGNMTPATMTMAGSTSMVSSMAAPAPKPTTVVVSTGGTTVTVVVTSSSAMVTSPTSTGSMVKSWQSAFMMSNGVKRGDLVFVSGVKTHGSLHAKLVLFAAPSTSTSTTGTGTTGTGTTGTGSTGTGTTSGTFSNTHS